jgi:hypothetical protein
VVTSAQFLIDSESKLREATAKMLQATEDKKQQVDKPTVMERPDVKGKASEHSEYPSPVEPMNPQQEIQYD